MTVKPIFCEVQLSGVVQNSTKHSYTVLVKLLLQAFRKISRGATIQ